VVFRLQSPRSSWQFSVVLRPDYFIHSVAKALEGLATNMEKARVYFCDSVDILRIL
jgi:hypothetical protein